MLKLFIIFNKLLKFVFNLRLLVDINVKLFLVKFFIVIVNVFCIVVVCYVFELLLYKFMLKVFF